MSQSQPSRGPFHIQIRVRYEETDAAGVVYYANYLRYFEVARVESLRAIGQPITEVEARGVLLPAVSADCQYKRPAHVDDLLDVYMWLDRRGRGSFGFAYEVRRDDELIATGHTRHAVVERGTMRPLRLDGWIGELVDGAAGWDTPEEAT
jgi:acyl-CoA thioester hydrolase